MDEKKRNLYVSGIINAVIAAAAGFLMVGVPFGKQVLPLCSILLFAVSCLMILVTGLNLKIKDGPYVILTLVLTAVTFALVAITESKVPGVKAILIGGLLGALIACAGIVRSLKNIASKKIAVSVVLNILALLFSVGAVIGAVIAMKGFVITI